MLFIILFFYFRYMYITSLYLGLKISTQVQATQQYGYEDNEI